MSAYDVLLESLFGAPAIGAAATAPKRPTGSFAQVSPAAGLAGFAQSIITLTDVLGPFDALLLEQLFMLAEKDAGLSSSCQIIAAEVQIITNSNTGSGVAIAAAGQNTSTATHVVNETSLTFAPPPILLFNDLQAWALATGAGQDLLKIPGNQPLQLVATLGILNSGGAAITVGMQAFSKYRKFTGQQDG